MSSPILTLKAHTDHRGSLVAIEGERDLPFPIRRVYYIYGGDSSPRGFHAHLELRELMICVAGSCRVIIDDGHKRSEVRLDKPDQAVMIENMTWREMHDISRDACILVIASHGYDEEDYVRDYAAFQSLIAGTNER